MLYILIMSFISLCCYIYCSISGIGGYYYYTDKKERDDLFSKLLKYKEQGYSLSLDSDEKDSEGNTITKTITINSSYDDMEKLYKNIQEQISECDVSSTDNLVNCDSLVNTYSMLNGNNYTYVLNGFNKNDNTFKMQEIECLKQNSSNNKNSPIECMAKTDLGTWKCTEKNGIIDSITGPNNQIYKYVDGTNTDCSSSYVKRWNKCGKFLLTGTPLGTNETSPSTIPKNETKSYFTKTSLNKIDGQPVTFVDGNGKCLTVSSNIVNRGKELQSTLTTKSQEIAEASEAKALAKAMTTYAITTNVFQSDSIKNLLNK